MRAIRSKPPPANKADATSSEQLFADFERTGNTCAFADLVRRHAPAVFAACSQITHNSHDAEDATQAVFLSLAMQARTGDGIGNVAAWLKKVARNKALDVRRGRCRRENREQQQCRLNGAADGAMERCSGNEIGNPADTEELRAILREEVEKLPAKYRLPLILHYYGGLTPQETSREIGCTPKTLAVRLFRARTLLGQMLRKRGITLQGAALGLAIGTPVVQGLLSMFQSPSASTASIPAITSPATPTPALNGLVRRIVHLVGTCLMAGSTVRLKLVACVMVVAMISSVAAGPAAHWCERAEMQLLQKLKDSAEMVRHWIEKPVSPVETAPPSFNAAPCGPISDANPGQAIDSDGNRMPAQMFGDTHVAFEPLTPQFLGKSAPWQVVSGANTFVTTVAATASRAAQDQMQPMAQGPVTLTGRASHDIEAAYAGGASGGYASASHGSHQSARSDHHQGGSTPVGAVASASGHGRTGRPSTLDGLSNVADIIPPETVPADGGDSGTNGSANPPGVIPPGTTPSQDPGSGTIQSLPLALDAAAITVNTPEPSALLGVSIGAAMLLRRRHRRQGKRLWDAGQFLNC